MYGSAVELADEFKAKILDEDSFPNEMNDLVSTKFWYYSYFHLDFEKWKIHFS